MNFYKLEVVQQVLQLIYGARRTSVGPRPRIEVWHRTVEGHRYSAVLAWEHGEEIVSARELLLVARALAIHDRDLLEEVEARGGLWLGPSPPDS